MKLYIWNKNVFYDYTSGIAFAIAEDADLDPGHYDDRGLLDEPDEVVELDRPFAAYKHGGG